MNCHSKPGGNQIVRGGLAIPHWKTKYKFFKTVPVQLNSLSDVCKSRKVMQFVFDVNIPSALPSCRGQQLQKMPLASWVQAKQLNFTLSRTSGSLVRSSAFRKCTVTQSEPALLRPYAKYSHSSDRRPTSHQQIENGHENDQQQ